MAKLDSLDIQKPTPKRRTYFTGSITPPPEVNINTEKADIIHVMENIHKEDIKGTIVQIHLDSIVPHEYQSRKHFDEESLKGLSLSIKANGIVNPLKVVKVGANYQVASGERRLRAARMAGLSHAPCIVIDEKQAIVESVLENLQREELNIFEEGSDYLKLLENGIYQNQKDMADGLGISMSRISEVLNFYRKIPLDDQKILVEAGKTSRQHLREFLKSDPSKKGKDKTASFHISVFLRSGAVHSKIGDYNQLSRESKEILAGELGKLTDLIVNS